MLELIIGGAQIVGRAFTRAVREEFRTSQQAAERAGGGRQGARRVANDSITGMTLQVHFMLKVTISKSNYVIVQCCVNL